MSVLGKLARLSKRRPYTVLFVVGLITASMIYGASQVSMTTEKEKFLPKDYASVKVSNILENDVGARPESELVLIEGDDLTTASSFRSIYEFQKKLEESTELQDYIIRIKSYPSILVSMMENRVENYVVVPDPKLEVWIDNLLSQLQVKRLTSRLLAENRDAALVQVLVNSQLSESKLHKRTETLHKYTSDFGSGNPHLEARNTGELSIGEDMRGRMNRDNRILIPAAIVVVIAVLFLVFRRISDTGLPFLVLGISAVWMIGTLGFLGIPFSMIFVALIPILLGVGIDYTIHMLNRYYEEREEGLAAGESAVRSVETVGVAILLTAVTTMIGFGSFGISDVPPVQQLGLFLASGVFYTFVLTTTMLPSLLILRDRKEKMEIGREERGVGRLEKALAGIASGVQQYGKTILASAAIVTAICAFSATGLTTSMSYEKFLPEGSESVQVMDDVQAHFKGRGMGGMLSYAMIRGDVLSPEGLKLMLTLQKEVKSDPRNVQEGLITRTSSLASLIKFRLREIPKSGAKIDMIVKRMRSRIPEKIKKFLPKDDEAFVYFHLKTKTSQDMNKAARIIRDHVKEVSGRVGPSLEITLDGKPAVGGGAMIFSDIMGSILPSLRNSIILAIVCIGIILGVIFRSAILGLMGSLPVILAVLWEFGALRVLGWPLGMMNMFTSALAIGIGVDFAIHIIYRFREEWKKRGKSPGESIKTSTRKVGRAISAAGATTIGVFAVLSLSAMPPIMKFGSLAGMVIFFAFIAALIILPPILFTYGARRD